MYVIVAALIVASAVYVLFIRSNVSEQELYDNISALSECSEQDVSDLMNIALSTKNDAFNRAFAYKRLYSCETENQDFEAAKVAGNRAAELFAEAGEQNEAEVMQYALDSLESIVNPPELTDEEIKRYEESIEEDEAV